MTDTAAVGTPTVTARPDPVALIDRYLSQLAGRTLASADEVSDLLLDVRLALTDRETT